MPIEVDETDKSAIEHFFEFSSISFLLLARTFANTTDIPPSNGYAEPGNRNTAKSPTIDHELDTTKETPATTLLVLIDIPVKLRPCQKSMLTFRSN
jgi:hypothetical protein